MRAGHLFQHEWTLELTDDERRAVRRPIAPGQWGGHQNFHHLVQGRLADGSRVVLSEGELDTAYRYAYKYGNGTWQKYSRAIVAAGLRAGWQPSDRVAGDV